MSKTVRRRTLLAAMMACGLLASGAVAQAQSYPSRPIRAIVPFAAGSATDIVARTFADQMTKTLGQSIVIENRPGANGLIGADAVAKATPDGYTILIGTNSTNAAAPALFNNVPFDMNKDFQPVSFLSSVPLIVAVSNGVPVRTLRELIDYAKGRTDLTFASASASQRVSTEMLMAMTGMKMTHVFYRSGPNAMQDLIAGRVTLFTADLGVMLPQVRGNTVRPLAVTSQQRSSQVPDLPTVDEAAGTKGYELIAWFGMFAPAGVPAEVVTKLNAAVRPLPPRRSCAPRSATISAWSSPPRRPRSSPRAWCPKPPNGPRRRASPASRSSDPHRNPCRPAADLRDPRGGQGERAVEPGEDHRLGRLSHRPRRLLGLRDGRPHPRLLLRRSAQRLDLRAVHGPGERGPRHRARAPCRRLRASRSGWP